MQRDFINKKCSHENNRCKVCAACGRKIVLGTRKIGNFAINENLALLLQKYSNSKFDLSNSKFPLSICLTCKQALVEREKNVSRRTLPVMPNFEDIELPAITRSRDDNDCNCFICLTARYKGHEYHKTKDPVIINKENGMYGSSVIANRKTQKPDLSIIDNTVRLCSTCLSSFGRGKPHVCSKSKSPENVLKVVENLPEKQQEQV